MHRVWPGPETTDPRTVVVHQETVQRVGIMVHKIDHDLEGRRFGDLIFIHRFPECWQEVEDLYRYGSAELAAIDLVLYSLRPLSIAVCDIHV